MLSHCKQHWISKVPPSGECRSQRTEWQVICKAPEGEHRLHFRRLANHMAIRSLTATLSNRWDFTSITLPMDRKKGPDPYVHKSFFFTLDDRQELIFRSRAFMRKGYFRSLIFFPYVRSFVTSRVLGKMVFRMCVRPQILGHYIGSLKNRSNRFSAVGCVDKCSPLKQLGAYKGPHTFPKPHSYDHLWTQKGI